MALQLPNALKPAWLVKDKSKEFVVRLKLVSVAADCIVFDVISSKHAGGKVNPDVVR